MKVLLLGATGNVGSRLAQALLAHKHQVVLYVRSASKLKALLPEAILSRVTVVTGDATDSQAIGDALVQNNCDAFVNSAGQAAVFPWQAPRMQDIETAVTTAGVNASKKLGRPLRCWFLGGMTALDVPELGVPIANYMPMFTEHRLTYATLSSKSLENLEWSLLCPSQMKPVNETIEILNAPREHSLSAAADVPPLYQPSYFNNIPFLGTYISLLGNGMRYTITLEDCADFIAADLEKKDSEFIGHRVGVIESGKPKSK